MSDSIKYVDDICLDTASLDELIRLASRIQYGRGVLSVYKTLSSSGYFGIVERISFIMGNTQLYDKIQKRQDDFERINQEISKRLKDARTG